MKPQLSDLGTPERGAKGDSIVLHDTDPRAGAPKRAYVVTQSSLARLWVRGQLGEGQTRNRRLEAGKRLGGLFYDSGLHPRTTVRYGEPGGGNGEVGYKVSNLGARQAYMQARDAIRLGCDQVVFAVCCLDEKPGGEARLECLRLGLDDLAGYWRLR